jgi:hypothetical protein
MPAIPIQLPCVSTGDRSDQQRLARGPKAAMHVEANTKILPLPGLEPWLSNPLQQELMYILKYYLPKIKYTVL